MSAHNKPFLPEDREREREAESEGKREREREKERERQRTVTLKSQLSHFPFANELLDEFVVAF